MTARKGTKNRTQDCGKAQAKTRLEDARQHLAYAELHGKDSKPSERKASVATAVLAAIAAADAACCYALGERSRSDDDRDAVNLVKQVAPGGAEAGNKLQRLLSLKDESQYGFGGMGGQKHEVAIRQAKALVEFAEQTLQR
jgi:nitroreductase